MQTLIVCAVDAEADAVRAGLSEGSAHRVITVGVGPAAAAAGTATALASGRYDAVVNAGVCGAFAGRAEVGDVVIADRSIAADLGVDLADQFQPLDDLGFGSIEVSADPALTRDVEGWRGDLLTLTSITGTGDKAQLLTNRFPKALAEAMEGFGAATAARQHGVSFAEIRTVSNYVGDRDVANWNWKQAFGRLTEAVRRL
ncbi:futalosine hydrolase [Haloglycomyces albus]|uniref:futalosine hydrolase n=1 Tax=Haloglycomyces albus TaxID=526067 RepID=UPI00046D10A3|nr:futalosine hydrolase [Haloglycomyces albus]